jgi:acyl carrier protein
VTAPTTDVERVVLDAWCAVLGTDAIGVDDNFFDVGGHSLLVVRLHRSLQERLGHPVPLTDLYRYPTVRTFSVSLADTNGEAPTAISSALDRAARRRANMRGRS